MSIMQVGETAHILDVSDGLEDEEGTFEADTYFGVTMLHPVAVQVRQQLHKYIQGGMSLTQFGEWLAPISWDIEKTADEATAELVYEIDTLLAERSYGHRTEDDLRREFERQVDVPRFGERRASENDA